MTQDPVIMRWNRVLCKNENIGINITGFDMELSFKEIYWKCDNLP